MQSWQSWQRETASIVDGIGSRNVLAIVVSDIQAMGVSDDLNIDKYFSKLISVLSNCSVINFGDSMTLIFAE